MYRVVSSCPFKKLAQVYCYIVCYHCCPASHPSYSSGRPKSLLVVLHMQNTITRTAKDSSSADVPCFTGAAGAKNISLDGDSQAKGSSSTAPEVYVISRDGSIRKVDQGEGVASKAGAENDCTQGSVPKWTEGSKFVIFVPDDSTCPTDEPVQCIYKALSDGRSRKPNWCTRKPLVPENTNKPLMREDTFKVTPSLCS